MRRQAFTFWQAAGLLAFIVILAAILLPILGRGLTPEPKRTCQTNLKQIMLAIKQYEQDYDEKFPKISIGRSGWADMLQPYVISRKLFRCPSVQGEPGATSDYFYNARLAGVAEAAVSQKNNLSQIITLGDGTFQAGTNANITELPFEWTRDESSPARRHLDGANYAFADGHVKWLKPEAIEANKPAKAGGGTFLIE